MALLVVYTFLFLADRVCLHLLSCWRHEPEQSPSAIIFIASFSCLFFSSFSLCVSFSGEGTTVAFDPLRKYHHQQQQLHFFVFIFRLHLHLSSFEDVCTFPFAPSVARVLFLAPLSGDISSGGLSYLRMWMFTEMSCDVWGKEHDYYYYCHYYRHRHHRTWSQDTQTCQLFIASLLIPSQLLNYVSIVCALWWWCVGGIAGNCHVYPSVTADNADWPIVCGSWCQVDLNRFSSIFSPFTL